MFDYVEFVAEYAPFDLYALDNFCRAVELFDMSAMIKVDQDPRSFLAQRGIGAGFQSVLFADCRSVEEVRQCVRIVRPDTPEDGGTYGVGMRRFTYMGYGGSPEYVQALRDVVVAIMIEKRSAVEQLEEILSVAGVDMIQWGPADYSMSIGRAGERNLPEVKAVERRVIDTALKMGVPPRAEISSVDQAKYYLDLGVRHFCIGTDVSILYNWWKANGNDLRKAISDA
jgi:4-hydroxy-2-oxoheptanedioate aldolase